MSDLLNEYEQTLRCARERFAGRESLDATIGGRLGTRRLHELVIHFCALGFRMTESVESWIRRAGQRCEQLGYCELGRSLVSHAAQEANHEKLFAADTRALVARWNENWSPPFDPQALLEQKPSPGVRQYCDLHEEVIASNTPYRQIAIEYEIESLSVREGAALLRAVLAKLGPAIASELSFVNEHVRVDQGHTKFNAKQLGRFLESHPETMDALTDAGARALMAYGQYLDDCFVASA